MIERVQSVGIDPDIHLLPVTLAVLVVAEMAYRGGMILAAFLLLISEERKTREDQILGVTNHQVCNWLVKVNSLLVL